MNLIEHYIKKIYSVKHKKIGKSDYVEVEFDINCYGNCERKIETFEVKRWEKIKKQGYYLG